MGKESEASQLRRIVRELTNERETAEKEHKKRINKKIGQINLRIAKLK